MVIKRPLGNMSLHSLLNAVAKIRINLEISKKKNENMHNRQRFRVESINNRRNIRLGNGILQGVENQCG